MPLRNWWGILCCGITGSGSGFQAQSWHKQSYIMVPHMLTPSPPCLSLPPPNLCFALFSVKSTLSWILCQEHTHLCAVYTQLQRICNDHNSADDFFSWSFLSSSYSFDHGADFCFTHSISNVYERPGIFNDSYRLSRLKFPLVQPSRSSLLCLKKP